LLLTGLQGLGKGVLAEAIAAQLLCTSATQEEGPCGRCNACAQLSAGSHPDYIRIQLEEDASVIKVDQIRLLAEKLSFSSHQGGYKVAVLDPAGKMNINAANSLLKTLEEPSDNTVLILVSAQSGLLPPTLRSRCQQFRIDAHDTGSVLQWLSGQLDIREPEIYLQLAENAPLEALRLAQQDAIGSRSKHFSELVDILDGRTAPLTVALAWSKDEDMQAIQWLRDWLMDLLRIRMTGRTDAVRSLDVVDGLEALAERLDSKIMFEQLDRINRTMQQAASGLNRQLMTEDILLAWAAQG